MLAPRSAARPRGSQGFTLLEIMVVVLIAGILVSFAVLSIGDRALADTLDNESRRMERLLVLAQEEAELQGLMLGLRLTEDQIQWVAAASEGRWIPYAESGPFRARPITPPVRVALQVEGREVPPAQTLVDPTASMEPQALFLTSGEATPMVLDLSAQPLKARYRIAVDPLGRVSRSRIDQDSDFR